MRLDILENGHSRIQKIQMAIIRTMMAGHLPGPVSTLSYRADFFGKAYNDACEIALRKQEYWTKAEAELFAAFVSFNNQCQYCYGAHTAVTVNGIDEAVVTAVINDYQTAPVNEKIRATLGFLKTLTRDPAQLTPADIEPMRQAGVPDIGIEEAIQIAFLFCTINRLADSFDYELAEGTGKKRMGFMLYKMGYGIGSLPG